MRGGKFLADERGAFDEAAEMVEAAPVVEAPAVAATAPLYEVAAAHDGQPAVDWLSMFYREYVGAMKA